jgi:small subunit ribosomal protein S20
LPNIKSAMKRVKLTKKQNERNASYKSSLKTSIKKFTTAANEKTDNVDALYKDVCSTIDKAASKSIMHKNKAARKKAQMAKIYKAI